MVRMTARGFALSSVVLMALSNMGCVSPMGCHSGCNTGCDGGCQTGCDTGCSTGCGTRCGWGIPCCGFGCGSLFGRLFPRSLAIPDQLPVGAVERAHFHQMQTNAEATDFIVYQMDFVAQTAELTPDGKDKINEIGARMRSAPYPVLIERTYNNADPELDAHRRELIAMILSEKGNPDANNRVFVSPAYGLGKSSLDAAPEFYQHTYQYGGFNGINGNGGGGGGGFGGGGGGFGGGGGGFGGGGGGGGGFGGGGFGM